MTLMTLSEKLHRMQALFREMGSVAVAFSGGIDSTVVLKVAHDVLDERAVGVTAVSPTFPAIELEGARRIGAEIGVRHLILETDQLVMEEFVRNDARRCYHCKTDLYRSLWGMQPALGFHAIVDGTNLDDLGDDRPGISAAREWKVRSPLVEAEMSKAETRTLAKELGLSNWDKPAAACLSSRIPRGTPITPEKLSRIERAERILFLEGLGQFRVRDHGEIARIEIDPAEIGWMQDEARRARISASLKAIGFRFVTLDLEGYRRGGADRHENVPAPDNAQGAG
jgi:uncharacterized protein